MEQNFLVCIIMTHCNGGDLLEKIKRKNKINETEARVHFRQLIEVLQVDSFSKFIYILIM